MPAVDVRRPFGHGSISLRCYPHLDLGAPEITDDMRAQARKQATGEPDRLRTWALDRERSRGHNKAAVALANKLARIVWAVWRNERAYATTEEPTD